MTTLHDSYWGKCTVHIERELSKGRPRTVYELSVITGINRSSLSKSISRMVNQRREAYVAEWKRDVPNGRAYLRPAYLLGNNESVAKPKRLSDATKAKRYRRATETKTEWRI